MGVDLEHSGPYEPNPVPEDFLIGQKAAGGVGSTYHTKIKDFPNLGSGAGLEQAPTPFGYDYAFQLQYPGFIADAGSYTLVFQGEETVPIQFDEDPYDALIALPNIGPSDINVFEGINNAIWYVFFIGALAKTPFVAGVDVLIGSQLLMKNGNFVTLVLSDWETGAEEGARTPITTAVVDIDGVNGIPQLAVNVGTELVPDWRLLNGWYAYSQQQNVVNGTVQLLFDQFYVQMAHNGVVSSSLVITADGMSIDGPTLGFFGVTPVSQIPYINPATLTPEQIGNILINLGLMASS